MRGDGRLPDFHLTSEADAKHAATAVLSYRQPKGHTALSRHESLALPAIDASHVGLRVEFVSLGRKVAHRIEAVVGDRVFPVLDSDEGDDDQPFPPSPPVQQLSFQQRDDGTTVALSVGMAGRNHWSMSVEACPDRRTVRFDVACRVSASADQSLGSTYRSSLLWHPSPDETCVYADVGGYRCCLRSSEDDLPSRGAAFGWDGRHVRICPPLSHEPVTRRWCYEAKLESCE